MQKRDFIRDEIERIGKIITQLVLGFKDLPTKENFLETNTAFIEKTNLDIESLLNKNHQELKLIFSNHQFTIDQIEHISEYLMVYSEQIKDISLQKIYAQTAKNILEYINLESQSISFSRMNIEQRLSKML